MRARLPVCTIVRKRRRERGMRTAKTERHETVVIGGGQAGLTVGYYLKQHGRPFVILDANERIGDAWRKRWDSLRLFTPARYDGLPGMPFPAPAWSFPTREEMADYLVAYAERFELPVRTGVRIDRLEREGDHFVATAGDMRFEAENVVVGSGAHNRPRTPSFASALDPRIVQLHSGEYRNPSQLSDGTVLLVGAGNSGAEIAKEVSRSHATVLAGRDIGQVPVRHGSVPARFFFRAIRFVGHRVLTRGTPIGRRVGPKLAPPLIRVKRKELAAGGVELVSKVAGVRDGLPALEDGRVLDVANVIWCTGFDPDFSWLDVPIFEEDGQLCHDRGVAELPGLYFVGLRFQYSLTSDVLPNKGRDAKYVARRIANAAEFRAAERRRAAPALAEAGTG